MVILILVAGPVVVGGLSALGAGLVSIGIPKNSVIQYETAVKTDNYLLMVHGAATDVEKSERDPAKYASGDHAGSCG